MRFVLRAWGTYYKNYPLREVKELGWVDAHGRVTLDVRCAFTFISEADAWLFAANADLLGHDEEGEWCFPEQSA